VRNVKYHIFVDRGKAMSGQSLGGWWRKRETWEPCRM